MGGVLWKLGTSCICFFQLLATYCRWLGVGLGCFTSHSPPEDNSSWRKCVGFKRKKKEKSWFVWVPVLPHSLLLWRSTRQVPWRGEILHHASCLYSEDLAHPTLPSFSETQLPPVSSSWVLLVYLSGQLAAQPPLNYWSFLPCFSLSFKKSVPRLLFLLPRLILSVIWERRKKKTEREKKKCQACRQFLLYSDSSKLTTCKWDAASINYIWIRRMIKLGD